MTVPLTGFDRDVRAGDRDLKSAQRDATDRARALLRDTVACPRVDADFIAACLDHFAAVGLIRVPAGV